MDPLGEAPDERETMAIATPLSSFSLVQNVHSSTNGEWLLALILQKFPVCKSRKISTASNTGPPP
jgi:hypothetical protein